MPALPTSHTLGLHRSPRYATVCPDSYLIGRNTTQHMNDNTDNQALLANYPAGIYVELRSTAACRPHNDQGGFRNTLSLAAINDMTQKPLRGPAGCSVPHGLMQCAALRTCGMLGI